MTGVPPRTQLQIRQKAVTRGWDKTIRGLEEVHVVAGKSTGRPRKSVDGNTGNISEHADGPDEISGPTDRNATISYQ